MPNINLIAQKRAEKARLESNIRRLFFLMSGLAVVAILMFTMLSARWFRLKSETASLREELTKLEPQINKIHQIERQTAELGPRIKLYGEARDHTMRWYTFLQVVARSVPNGTWLTRLSPGQNKAGAAPATSGSAQDVTMNLAGVTTSQKLVGDTMMCLSSYSALLDKVDLHYTQEGKEADKQSVEFELATNVKGLPPEFTGAPPASASGSNGAAGGANANQAKS